MPRYDDRYGNARLYVGRLSSRTRSRDLEYLFSKYGRIREVELKRDYAFIVCEFYSPQPYLCSLKLLAYLRPILFTYEVHCLFCLFLSI
ncbi:hypothetical protein VPH35_000675 [Triticum aestivum]